MKLLANSVPYVASGLNRSVTFTKAPVRPAGEEERGSLAFVFRDTAAAAAKQRQVIDLEREPIACEQILLEAGQIGIWDLDMLAALLADQMVVMLARRVIFVVELTLAGADRR